MKASTLRIGYRYRPKRLAPDYDAIVIGSGEMADGHRIKCDDVVNANDHGNGRHAQDEATYEAYSRNDLT